VQRVTVAALQEQFVHVPPVEWTVKKRPIGYNGYKGFSLDIFYNLSTKI
jgi:hypothetical protein